MRAALATIERRQEPAIERWMRISRVAALSGQEAARAELVAGYFRTGALSVRILPDGNVEARLAGTGSGAPAVICAHLDALHVPTEDNPVVRDEIVLRGPGVLDDASGLVAIIEAASALAAAGYQPVRELRFVATVSEEVGLLGARSYVASNPHLAGFVSVDGILGAVDHGATGISWTRYRFLGRGGHALLAGRTPSPAFAAGRAIAAIADIGESVDDPVNVGIVRGGTAPNAVPTEVELTVDLRSDDPARLAKLELDVQRVTQAAADREGVKLEVDVLQSLPAVQLPGHARSPLVLGATDILGWLDLPASVLPRGSSDHNMALIAGIPAIAVGATTGRHAHAPREVADIRLLERGTKQVVLLAVLLGEGLPEPTPRGAAAQ